MAFTFYLGGLRLPVTPEQVNISSGNQNKTFSVINYGEINVVKPEGLRTVNFDFLVPAQFYHFSDSYISADSVISTLSSMKAYGSIFQFIITRPGAGATNIKVVIEDFTIKQVVNEGRDYIVSINLKEYRWYGTRTINKGILKKEKQKRVQQKSPAPKNDSKGYSVKSGDCLWTIITKHYGKCNWDMVKKVQSASNSGGVSPKITNPNLIYPGQKLTLPPL